MSSFLISPAILVKCEEDDRRMLVPIVEKEGHRFVELKFEHKTRNLSWMLHGDPESIWLGCHSFCRVQWWWCKATDRDPASMQELFREFQRAVFPDWYVVMIGEVAVFSRGCSFDRRRCMRLSHMVHLYPLHSRFCEMAFLWVRERIVTMERRSKVGLRERTRVLL